MMRYPHSAQGAQPSLLPWKRYHFQNFMGPYAGCAAVRRGGLNTTSFTVAQRLAASGDTRAEGKSRMRRLSNPGNVSPLDDPVAHGLQQAAFRSRTIAIRNRGYMSHKRGCV